MEIYLCGTTLRKVCLLQIKKGELYHNACLHSLFIKVPHYVTVYHVKPFSMKQN